MELLVKILVIEDEDNIRENIQELLEAKGYHVRTASNGKQGILEAIDFRPSLILCDIMMPKMDGFKVLEYIRKTSTIQNVPFIFLTAKIDTQDVRHGMELGADDYLTKPFTSKDLVNAIETRLKKQQKIIGEYAKVKHELDTTVFATYYHEFNTPLHGIIGGINLLINARDSFSDKQIQELLYSILKSGLRLNHSLANLMLFEEIKRAEVYTELLTMFSNGKTSGNWPQRIFTELNTMATEIYNRSSDLVFDMQAADLNINPEYLLRIILELTDNALKFSKRDQRIHVTGKKQGDSYLIEVRDIGRGFVLETLDQIAPFKQFSRTKFEQQGLGIGLYLVKRLVEFNSGELKINSSESVGTTVDVTLPSLGL
jgi:CheY-like chemotaxis protein